MGIIVADVGNLVRFVGLLLLGTVLITALPLDAGTSGGKCAKAGIIQTTKSVKYKCAKSGKVLRWVLMKPAAEIASTNTTMSTLKGVTDGGICAKVGDQSTVSGGYLECRAISGGTNRWFKLSTGPAAVSVPAGGSSLDACKLTEARINKFQQWNIGFPRGTSGAPTLPSTGVSSIQLIAVDFSDAVGTAEELTAADTQISEFNKWFDFTSNGALSFRWQYPKRWLRMSRSVLGYALVKGDRATVLSSLKHN